MSVVGPVDRLICHILMVMFTYVYLKTFVHRPSVVDGIIAQMHELTDDNQLKATSRFGRRFRIRVLRAFLVVSRAVY